jgi:hypothetical protein
VTLLQIDGSKSVLAVDLRGSPCCSEPYLYVWPVPEDCLPEHGDGLGEVRVASPPVVDRLRTLDARAFSDALRVHYEADIDRSPHG